MKKTTLLLFPMLILLNSCAGLVGGVAGGVAGAKGPDPDTIQTVALRSRYTVDCGNINTKLSEFFTKNKEINTTSPDVGHICREINSSDDIFKSCLTVKPEDQFRVADGTFWTSYDFYLIQIQKQEKECHLFLYTRLDFDISGNPFSSKSSCQNGLDKKCADKFQTAKEKREKIKGAIEKRSSIVFNPPTEEKIFNYYSTEKALQAFEQK